MHLTTSHHRSPRLRPTRRAPGPHQPSQWLEEPQKRSTMHVHGRPLASDQTLPSSVQTLHVESEFFGHSSGRGTQVPVLLVVLCWNSLWREPSTPFSSHLLVELTLRLALNSLTSTRSQSCSCCGPAHRVAVIDEGRGSSDLIQSLLSLLFHLFSFSSSHDWIVNTFLGWILSWKG